MKKKNRCRKSGEDAFFETISRNLDIPADAVSGYARIEMSGNREISIDGCLGVLEYSENAISINTGRLTVKICGAELTVVSMQNGQAAIKGIITCVDFCNREEVCW
ncbi:MAG: YabP/YqfC family sporulation protein [Clostridia bacterium]|nr:YabP/YqfC family sporulation protein [Clostridia bacterium]